MYPSNWTLFYFSDVYLALDTLHIYLTNDRQCLAYQAQNITQVLNYTFSSSSRRPTHQRGHARRHALLGRRPAGRRDQQSALVHGLRHLLGCYTSLTDRDQPLTCASCPDASQVFSSFGCSAVTQVCTCGVHTTQDDSCTSNYECYFQEVPARHLPAAHGPGRHVLRQPVVLGLHQAGHRQRERRHVRLLLPAADPPAVRRDPPASSCPSPPPPALGLPLGRGQDPGRDCPPVGRPLRRPVRPAQPGLRVLRRAGALLSTPRFLADGLPFELHSAQSAYPLPESDAEHALPSEDCNGTAEPSTSLAHLYQQSTLAARGFLTLGPPALQREFELKLS